jgi:hypothetical protein
MLHKIIEFKLKIERDLVTLKVILTSLKKSNKNFFIESTNRSVTISNFYSKF